MIEFHVDNKLLGEFVGRVQNMDPWSMDPLRGPGPWTGSMDPLIMDRVHGPPIFTS